MLITVKIAGLAIDPSTDVPIVVLQDEGNNRTLPIYIGYFEASAIAMELQKQFKPHRPLTHDLFKNVLDHLGVTLLRVEITDLRENTFYAYLYVEHDGRVIQIDARPSDAIAMALRSNATILVEERVFSLVNRSEPGEDKLKDYLESLDPDAFGKYKM